MLQVEGSGRVWEWTRRLTMREATGVPGGGFLLGFLMGIRIP